MTAAILPSSFGDDDGNDDEHTPEAAARAQLLDEQEAYQRHLDTVETVFLPSIKSCAGRDGVDLQLFERGKKKMSSLLSIPYSRKKYKRIKDFPAVEILTAFDEGSSLAFQEVRSTIHIGGSPLQHIAQRHDPRSWRHAELIEKVNYYHVISKYIVQGIPPFLPRLYVSSELWMKLEINDETLSQSRNPTTVCSIYLLVTVPATHTTITPDSSFVLGTFYSVTYFFEHSSTSTEAVIFCRADPGGQVPHAIVNKVSVQSMTGEIFSHRIYYLRHTRLSDLRPTDGTVLGEMTILAMLATPSSSSTTLDAGGGGGQQRGAATCGADSILAANESLRDFHDLHPWFKDLLVAVLENRAWIDKEPYETTTRLDDLAAQEASIVGQSLNFHLMSPTSTSSAAATAAWVASVPALVDLCEEHSFFLPMMSAVAKRLANEPDWGSDEVKPLVRAKAKHTESLLFASKIFRNTLLVAILPCFAAYFVLGAWVTQRASQYYGDDRQFFPSVTLQNVTVTPVFPGYRYKWYVSRDSPGRLDSIVSAGYAPPSPPS